MGEVYRARDTRLERTVAIKILPRELSPQTVWPKDSAAQGTSYAALTISSKSILLSSRLRAHHTQCCPHAATAKPDPHQAEASARRRREVAPRHSTILPVQQICDRSQFFNLLLTDVVMPKMRGPELTKRLKGLRTRLRIVYMSGYLEYNRGNDDFLEEGFFLQKPFSRDTLVFKVGEALRNNSKSRT